MEQHTNSQRVRTFRRQPTTQRGPLDDFTIKRSSSSCFSTSPMIWPTLWRAAGDSQGRSEPPRTEIRQPAHPRLRTTYLQRLEVVLALRELLLQLRDFVTFRFHSTGNAQATACAIKQRVHTAAGVCVQPPTGAGRSTRSTATSRHPDAQRRTGDACSTHLASRSRCWIVFCRSFARAFSRSASACQQRVQTMCRPMITSRALVAQRRLTAGNIHRCEGR